MKMMSWSRYRLRSLLRAARRKRAKAAKDLSRGERAGRYVMLPQPAPDSTGPGYTRTR